MFALPLLRTQLNELLAGANVFQPLEVAHAFPDVGLRTLCVDAHPLSLPGQSGRRILLTFQDITARKHAEGANARLAAIVESSDDAIVGKTIEGIITNWNSGAERIFGYAPGDVIGKPITVLIPSDRHDEEPGILERIKCGERVEHYDTVRQRKDGTLVDVSLSVSPIKDATGRVIGASKIARDITQRKDSQKRQEFLTQEIHHRTNNIFSVVQAVISPEFR